MLALYKGAYTTADFDYLIAILRGLPHENQCTTSCDSCNCRRACADIERLLKYSTSARNRLEGQHSDT